MAGAARVNVEVAGGVIVGNFAPTVIINNNPVAVFGATVAGHLPGGIHASPTMVGSSSTVFANGIAVCRAGDAASCGHTASPGSSDVNIG